MALTLNEKFLNGFVGAHELESLSTQTADAFAPVCNRSGAGADFLGWVDLPQNYDKEEFDRIKKAAKKIQSDSDVLVVIGIGGSYLGARAAIEFLKNAETVKHGRWSPSGGYVTTAYGTKRYQICSACGVDLLEDDGVYNFCPNCGARMDGDSE